MDPKDDRIAELEKKLATLEAKVNPRANETRHTPIDYTANMSMPPSVLREMINAPGVNQTMATVITHDRNGPAKSSSMLPERPASSYRPAIPSQNGWVKATPLPSSPPGINIIDRMVDAADAAERAAQRNRTVKLDLQEAIRQAEDTRRALAADRARDAYRPPDSDDGGPEAA